MPNRTMCEVLEEVRTMHKTRNYAGLLGAVEELQIMGNRMEAALHEQRDYQRWHEKVKEERKEMARLRKAADKLRQEKGEKPLGVETINRW